MLHTQHMEREKGGASMVLRGFPDDDHVGHAGQRNTQPPLLHVLLSLEGICAEYCLLLFMRGRKGHGR